MSADRSKDVLFFDLDGTLIDSQVGITACIAYALQKMDHPVPPQETLLGWIGPSLRTTFAPLFVEPARVEQAVGYYRERFDAEGWREHTVYPQVEDTLRTLHGRGHRLAVVTAKNEPTTINAVKMKTRARWVAQNSMIRPIIASLRVRGPASWVEHPCRRWPPVVPGPLAAETRGFPAAPFPWECQWLASHFVVLYLKFLPAFQN